jgi:hypothetical protein
MSQNRVYSVIGEQLEMSTLPTNKFLFAIFFRAKRKNRKLPMFFRTDWLTFRATGKYIIHLSAIAIEENTECTILSTRLYTYFDNGSVAVIVQVIFLKLLSFFYKIGVDFL